MSETTSSIAEAMASMDAADNAQQPNSAPQAEPIAETPAETPAPPASAEQTDDDESQEDARGTKSRAEPRIKQLSAQVRDAREEAAYWRGQAEQQRQQPSAPPVSQQQAQPLPADLAQYLGDPPDPLNFDKYPTPEAYEDARIDFKFRQREVQQALNQRRHAARQQQAEFQTKLGSIIDVGSAKYADFAAKALNESVPMTAAMVREIAESDSAADVAYFLGSNPAEAKRIAALPAERVAREIGRIEARLEAQAEAKAAAAAAPPPQPSAAPPPPPRAPRGNASAGFDWSTATPAQIQARINGG